MAFETVIGLEIHIELKTETKIFCSCKNSFGAKPNSLTCPICMGLPGTLPSLNKKVVLYAVKTALALDSNITNKTIMDRKNYFYPDLPKAYQISQLYYPLATGGGLNIDTPDGSRFIRIHELHIEEDAGKLIHDSQTNKTIVDYNRCGVPLIEIVTEPDFRGEGEVISFLELLKRTLKFISVSDCKIEEGSMRVDVNLSVREEGHGLGTRTETKNLSSFKAISNAIDYESKRQIEVLKSGQKVDMETRRFDENRLITLKMRPKEEYYQYRYFPEPDITPIYITKEYIDSVREEMPILPSAIKKIMTEEDNIPSNDSEILTSEPFLTRLYFETKRITSNPKESSNWILSEFMKVYKGGEFDMPMNYLGEIINMVSEGKINRQTGKEVLFEVISSHESPEDYIISHGLTKISDENIIRTKVVEVIRDNSKAADEYKAGITKSFGYLMGRVMKALDNKADPGIVKSVLKEELEE